MTFMSLDQFLRKQPYINSATHSSEPEIALAPTNHIVILQLIDHFLYLKLTAVYFLIPLVKVKAEIHQNCQPEEIKTLVSFQIPFSGKKWLKEYKNSWAYKNTWQ